jgi:hypothetical protein
MLYYVSRLPARNARGELFLYYTLLTCNLFSVFVVVKIIFAVYNRICIVCPLLLV